MTNDSCPCSRQKALEQRSPLAAGEAPNKRSQTSSPNAAHLAPQRVGEAAIEVFAQVIASYAGRLHPPRAHNETAMKSNATHLITDQRTPADEREA